MNGKRPSFVSAGLALAFLAVGLASGPAAAVSRDVRGTTNTNVNRSANVNSNTNVNRNVNVNQNVNVNRNVNVDVDYRGGACCYHPVAAAAAVGTAAAVTAAAIGSVTYALPPACVVSSYGGITYQNCGGTWYRPQYAGTSVQYVVVAQPY
jgi:hypothetical protein